MALPMSGFDTGSLLQLVNNGAGGEPDPTSSWSPEEKFLYQMHRDNLAAGGLKRPDGSTSTIYNTTVEINGKTYVLPTIWKDGTGVPIEVSPDAAIERAQKIGLDKFPSYKTEDEAEKRYGEMHEIMEKDMPDPAEDPSNKLRQNFLQRLKGSQ
jgi:hypothetical protein